MQAGQVLAHRLDIADVGFRINPVVSPYKMVIARSAHDGDGGLSARVQHEGEVHRPRKVYQVFAHLSIRMMIIIIIVILFVSPLVGKMP